MKPYFRNLFGGSVGPIRKQLPNGQFQNVYDGVKVRAQPLPLRVPTSPQQQANAVTVQQQTQVNQVEIPIILAKSSETPTTSPPTSIPSSPILTNLLHKKIPGNPTHIDDSIPTLDTKVCFRSAARLPERFPTSGITILRLLD